MAEEVRHRNNILSCELLKKTNAELSDIKLKLECLSLQNRNVDEKDCCTVELNNQWAESVFHDLIDTAIELLTKLKISIPDHGRRHPAQSGRKDTDSGYCQSGDISRLSGIAERQDYPSFDSPSLLSICHETDTQDESKNTSNC